MKTSIAIALVMTLAGCETAPPEQAEDRTQVAPEFTEAQIVDVAVLAPEIETADREILLGRIRPTAHEYLIREKDYAVPEDAYVDRAVAALPGGGEPSRAAEATGSDAALLVSLTQWDSDDLLPKGRVLAGGTLMLQGRGQTYWQRTFRNRLLLAPRSVTASNRTEVVDGMARDLVRDLLSTLPPKVKR